MSCPQSCFSTIEEIRRTREFIFLKSTMDFNTAVTTCEQLNAELATVLLPSDYSALDRCCNGSNLGYRIGLLSDNDTCASSKRPYYWYNVGNALCTAGDPLTLEEAPPNCQSVQIFPGSSDRNTLMSSKWLSCNALSSAICQRVSILTTEVETITTSTAARQSSILSATKTKIFEDTTVTITKISATSLFDHSTISDFRLNDDIKTSISSLIPAIAGSVSSLCVILFLILFLIICRKNNIVKNKARAKHHVKPSCSSFSSANTTNKMEKNSHNMAASSLELPQLRPSNMQVENNTEDGYAPPNIQLDIHPYATSQNNTTSYYENHRQFSVINIPKNYATFITDPIYLTVDGSDQDAIAAQNDQNNFNQKANPKDQNHKQPKKNNESSQCQTPQEKSETVYVKPFN